MIVTIFRNRLRPEHAEEYGGVVARMAELASTMPGYLSHKTFAAPDGDDVVAEWQDHEHDQEK